MEYEEIINGKTILVTGGTGSLGHQIVNYLSKYSPKEIIILSRDENKQYHMKNLLMDLPFLSFELGDVRDLERMKEVTKNIDLIIHAAALKHVPPSEKEPMEFIKTNILGTKNICDSAIYNKVPLVLGISTDKAVKPTNVYGMTKSLEEKIMIAANRKSKETRFICVRYGNVLGSRGSVIPFFLERLKNEEPLKITVPDMTRFFLRLVDAVDLILYAAKKGKGGEIFVKKMSAVTILDLAKAISKKISGKIDYPIEIIGAREGEKIHEVLVSEEEMRRSMEEENNYIVYDYGKLKEPGLINKSFEEYTSNITKRLSQEEIIKLLEEDGLL